MDMVTIYKLYHRCRNVWRFYQAYMQDYQKGVSKFRWQVIPDAKRRLIIHVLRLRPPHCSDYIAKVYFMTSLIRPPHYSNMDSSYSTAHEQRHDYLYSPCLRLACHMRQPHSCTNHTTVRTILNNMQNQKNIIQVFAFAVVTFVCSTPQCWDQA